MRKVYRVKLTKTGNEANDLLNSKALNAKGAVVKVIKIYSVRESLNSVNEKAASFVTEKQRYARDILEEKVVVVIARWEQGMTK